MDSEILIIGGGMAGVSTAYHLAELGYDVVLLERGRIASEASGVNAGMISVQGWGAEPDLQSTLCMGSARIFKMLQIDLGIDIEFRQSGKLTALQTEAQYAFAQKEVQRLRDEGYSTELLTIQDARSIEPAVNPELFGFMYEPLAAQANPLLATQAFAELAVQQGVRIFTNHTVTGIQPHGEDAYRVRVGHHVFNTELLVLAAGAWCGPLGEMMDLSIPIEPVRGQMWATEPLPPRVFQTISSAESALYWHSQTRHDSQDPPHLTHSDDVRLTRHLYGRQTHNGEIIFGGDRQALGFERHPEPTGISVNKDHAAELFPFLKRLPIRRTWAGLMPFSMDGLPIIGRLPGHTNAYIVSGLASSGFGRGPMAGKLLAEFINSGQRPRALTEADPARCVQPLTAAPRPADAAVDAE